VFAVWTLVMALYPPAERIADASTEFAVRISMLVTIYVFNLVRLLRVLEARNPCAARFSRGPSARRVFLPFQRVAIFSHDHNVTLHCHITAFDTRRQLFTGSS